MSRAALCAAVVFAIRLSAQPSPPRPAPAKTEPSPAMEGGARRNENVQVNRIDNDAIKEAGVRLGSTTTLVSEAPVETSYFATEHGQAPAGTPFLAALPVQKRWRGMIEFAHQNSIFNARTFFQVGPVQPSRRNVYGGRLSGPAGPLGALTLNASQRKIRGMVNGNVLVPLAGERTSTSPDPAVRTLINRWLRAYPEGLPNRLDFDPRALNTNAPQRTDETTADLRLDRDLNRKTRGSAFYALSRQRIDAFQLVAGQNPDTEIHSHRARLTLRRQINATTGLDAATTFQRVRSLLTAEPNAVGPRLRFGYQIEELGPDSQFPINRALNTWRGGLALRKQAGRHALTFGGDAARTQLNGVESNNERGMFQFGNNFGRTALENFRYGTPTSYEVTVGGLARGFRNWSANLYAGDKVKATQRLDLYFGLRYGLITAPSEVDGLNEPPFACDCNNFSPRFAIAWRFRDNWVVRTSYSVSFGEIPPVTWQQIRNNPPLVRYFQLQNVDLLSPLAGQNLNDPHGRTSPTIVSPDLVAPYSHQYNFSIEHRAWGRYPVRLSYIGSRSLKMLNGYILNRAEPVPGIPLTTATVDQRRPDPRYYDTKHVLNGGMAYLEAAQASVQLPAWRGLNASASYTFGKAIDEGVDYSGTAANKDLLNNRSQWQYEALKDRRQLSLFDSTHAVSLQWAYDLPRPGAARGWAARAASGWQLSGAAVLKSGTPLTLFVGSDGPGFGNVDGGPSDRPNILDPSILGMTIGDPDTAPLILRRDRFAYIRPGEHRGDLGRGTFRKSPIANLNAALGKEWHFANGSERTVLFRAEAYNLANHPQFDEPQRNLTSPAFGKITNTLNDGRVFQFQIRITL